MVAYRASSVSNPKETMWTADSNRLALLAWFDFWTRSEEESAGGSVATRNVEDGVVHTELARYATQKAGGGDMKVC